MRYLVDTNLVTNSDQPRVRTWLLQHYLQLAISSITVAEIAQGIEPLPQGRRRKDLEGMLEDILQDYQVSPFGVAEGRRWGQYVSSQPRPVPILDSLIAATALANNLEVATANESDFTGVQTVNPLRA